MNSTFPAFVINIAVAGALCLLIRPLPAVAGELDVSANTPTVVISTRPTGRNFVRLPSLDYLFAIDAQCPAELQPSAITISIADTRVSLRGADLTVPMPLRVPVTVPASQIGPIPVDRYCTANQAETADTPEPNLPIPAVLSAQISLLCAGESDSAMTYASNSLDVVLQCVAASGEEAEPPTE
jgi:hypothetical protein